MPRTSDLNVDPCIVFEDVRKTFKLRHGKFFKEAVIAALTRKNSTTEFNAVDDLSFDVYPGEAVAVLGRNGSGKSTTLKLLSGVLRPDAGWIGTQGRVAGLLEVGAGFHPDLTGRDNVYLNAAILGMSRQETDERFDEIVEFAEIGEFIDTEVKRYSSGMYSRLGFAVAVHTELDVLLVDEVLSVGDAEFREKCNAKMKELQQQGKTMFIVSHNASQVKQLCQRGIVLDHGKKIFDGPIAEAVDVLNPKAKTKAKPAEAKPAAAKPAAAKPAAVKPAGAQPAAAGAAAAKPQQAPSPQTPKPEVTAPPAPKPVAVPTPSPATSPEPASKPAPNPEPVSPTAPASPAAHAPAAPASNPAPAAPAPSAPPPTRRATPAPQTPRKPDASPDTLQARLAAMNRLKEREANNAAVSPTTEAPLPESGAPRTRRPRHGA